MTTTINHGEPLELLGVQPGITVVDPATVLTRLWYFDGKFLRAEGFRRDQQYVRSLVALSNQAGGHGVVHGFDVRRGDGDRIAVDGGLAIAPSGRVVHLPSLVRLSVAELIARSFGDLAGPASGGHGSAEFGLCPPQPATDDVTVVPPRPVYVLTVASAEALCGEEERFGQLCEGACATETDRELVVEGVRFRLRELDLQLPVSTRVPFDERHLRSQVATAYFAREARSPASAISGAGLRSGVWCDGADAVAGEEVPLAVLGRSGSGGVWLDMWTARRELVETNPHRYWAGRLAMRPWPVFLAHLLQFQCQLTDQPADGDGGGGGEGPCADERAALVETDRVLTALLDARARIPAAAERLDRLRLQISGVLAGDLASPSGSILVDRGHVTVPSGAYLPVRPSRPVEQQVRALFGPGVDLRFCAVRPDFVPEALQEAQHMERISLTRGIDDPSDLEQVDVLVPGGRFTEARPVGGFQGTVRILPSLLEEVDHPTVEGSALSLSAVARDQVQEGWSWSAAAFGEAPHRLAVSHLADLAGFVVAKETGDEEAAPAELYIEHDEVHDDAREKAAFRQRLLREGVLARERLDRAVRGGFAEADEDVAPDRPLPRDEKRPVAIWLDVETAADLREVAVGAQTTARLRLTAYSRAAVEPLLVDVRISGGLVVTARQTAPVGGSQVMDIRTELTGVADVYVLLQGEEEDPPPRSVRGVALRWRVALGPQGARILAVDLEDARYRAAGQETGMPRHVSVVVTGPAPRSRVDLGAWRPRAAAAAATGVQLATMDLDESEHALDPGSPGRDLAESVIDVLGAELAVRGVDPEFAAPARRRMFESTGGGRTLTSTTDWVMFHRRRTRDCGDAGPQAPVATRRFRWYHAEVRDGDSLAGFADLAGRYVKVSRARGDIDAARVRPRLDGLGFEPVTVVEFPRGASDLVTPAVQVRNAWGTTRRASHLVRGVVAAPATGDGTHVDLARLTATTSVVSDLVDTSGLQVSAITDIPPEFQEAGLDGVFFTIGVDRPTRRLRMMVAKVTDLTSWLDQGDGDDITVERLRETFGDNLEVDVAEWDDTTLVNRAEIESWWGGSAVKAARFVVAASVDTAEERTYAEETATVLTRLLGGPDRPRPLDPSPYVDAGDDTEVLLILLASG